MTVDVRLREEARQAKEWLAKGGAIKAGDTHIERLVEALCAAALDANSEQRVLEQSLIVHLRTGDNSGVYRAFERGWREGRKWTPTCPACLGSRRVKTRNAGWVRCPGCTALVHFLEEGSDLPKCTEGHVAMATSISLSDVTCPDCLHALIDVDADDGDALDHQRWIARVIAFLRHGSTDRAGDANRAELTRFAENYWKGSPIWEEAFKARCACGRRKHELMTSGHAPGCLHEESDG